MYNGFELYLLCFMYVLAVKFLFSLLISHVRYSSNMFLINYVVSLANWHVDMLILSNTNYFNIMPMLKELRCSLVIQYISSISYLD